MLLDSSKMCACVCGIEGQRVYTTWEDFVQSWMCMLAVPLMGSSKPYCDVAQGRRLLMLQPLLGLL